MQLQYSAESSRISNSEVWKYATMYKLDVWIFVSSNCIPEENIRNLSAFRAVCTTHQTVFTKKKKKKMLKALKFNIFMLIIPIKLYMDNGPLQ